MEVMEEGNLMDRVRILLQHDMTYYQTHQTVLQENICPGVVGGLLDFPHYASFAAYKMVVWWEQEYVAAFMHGSGLIEACTQAGGEPLDDDVAGVVITSTPEEFVTLTTSTAAQLLDHLHTLSQEALDHADLTVLTGTLGAAALVKNCLWCYNEQLKIKEDTGASLSLHSSYKKYHEMAEALAERLLDLHCRLLSLYVLQDADCLNWESQRPFFEGERGSFIIQMWWLYMQGTREDLWNTVPPKMAQRVLAGMLNESLTILTVRYTQRNLRDALFPQALCSSARSSLLVADVTDLLLCVRQLLPAICGDASELAGHAQRNKVIKDVHAKCHQLLICLLFRACPLPILYKVFCKGRSEPVVYQPMLASAPSVWVVLTSPHIYASLPANVSSIRELPDGAAISAELAVLVAQPQACWPLLLRVLMMRECKVLNLLLQNLITKSESSIEEGPVQSQPNEGLIGQCGGFLCSGGGDCSLGRPQDTLLPPGVVVRSLVYILVQVGGPNDLSRNLLPALDKIPNWGGCLDRRQVWNQSRPPWLDAIIRRLEPILIPVTKTVVHAMQNGAMIDEAVSLALDCLIQLADVIPPAVLRAASLMDGSVAADVSPSCDSVLLQWLMAELYTQLIGNSGNLATALAEALCSIDENTVHAAKVRQFLLMVKECEDSETGEDFCNMENVPNMAEVLVSDLLLTANGRRSLKVMWQYLQHSWVWVASQLGGLEKGMVVPASPPPIPAKASRPAPTKLLHTMCHMGYTNLDNLDWHGLFQTHLSLSKEEVWMQLLWRAEFREPEEYLSQHDLKVVRSITKTFCDKLED